jgi:hypothetical protein
MVLTSNVDAEVEPVEKAGAPAPAKQLNAARHSSK